MLSAGALVTSDQSRKFTPDDVMRVPYGEALSRLNGESDNSYAVGFSSREAGDMWICLLSFLSHFG